ncbi:MAG: hypothetical protein K6A80_08760 [Saccharofermentans sp.]|nr:hypothetical protein [Saccharofermentans sp.]
MAPAGRPPLENPKRKQLCFRVSDELYDKMNQYAAAHNKTVSDVAIECLEEFIENKED